MGHYLTSISMVYALTLCSTLTDGHDYHVYLSKETSSNSIGCSPATPRDTCTIHCDQTPQYQYTFDCGDTAYCTFQCEATNCANYAIINATNVAHNLTVQSSGSDCMKYSAVYLPNAGNAHLSTQKGDSFDATTIHAGKSTQHIRMDCALQDCIETVINAQTAQSLKVTVGKDRAFRGQTGLFGRQFPAIINCPQRSHSTTATCAIDLSNGGSMEYATINTLYGIPRDLSIKTGRAFNAVTLTCKAYGKSSVITSNEGIAKAACNVPITTTPSPKSTFTTSTRTPTTHTTITTSGSNPVLMCDDEKQGRFTGTQVFDVRMVQQGEIIFSVKTSAALVDLTAEYGGTRIARDGDNDGRLMLGAGVGVYQFVVTVADGMESTYDVEVLCETMGIDMTTTAVVVPSPTKKPTLRPTSRRVYSTMEPSVSRETTTARPTVGVRSSTAKPTRRWMRYTTARPTTSEGTADDGWIVSEVSVEGVTTANGTRLGVEGLVIPPEDTFKDVFLANLGFVVIGFVVLCLCVFAVGMGWRRAQKRKSEEWVALV